MSLEEIDFRLAALERAVAALMQREAAAVSQALPPNGHEFSYGNTPPTCW